MHKKLLSMEVHIDSVKAMSQAGNIWVKNINNDNTKAKAERKLAWDLENLHNVGKFSRGPHLQEQALLRIM